MTEHIALLEKKKWRKAINSMRIIKQTKTILECCNEYKNIHVVAKWDGCCDITRYYNGFTCEDKNVPVSEEDYIHICDLREFIDLLTKIADKAEEIEDFRW